jgi:acetolactate decarboxylase
MKARGIPSFYFCGLDGSAAQGEFQFSFAFANWNASELDGGKKSGPFFLLSHPNYVQPDVQHTLYQVSTANALVEGIYEGAVRVGTLRKHGTLGLGTFENLDGEMVIVDGDVFQVRSDGSVVKVADDVLIPFAAITNFTPGPEVVLDSCPDLAHLTARFDGLRQSDNMFYALKVDGEFDYIHTRAMRRTVEGVPLVEAAAVQPEFEFQKTKGTLVGFWTPDYARTLNVPGYHLHFISDDRRHGGHLLQCRGKKLGLQIQLQGDYHIVLPETSDFMKANLKQDPTKALAQAEGERK